MTTSWDTFDDDVTRPYRPSDAGSGPDTGTLYIDDDLTSPFLPGATGAHTASRPALRHPAGLEIEADGVAVVLPDDDRQPRADGFAPATQPATSAPAWAQAPPGTFRPWEPTPRPTLEPRAVVVRSRRGGRARLLAVIVVALVLSAFAALLVLRWLGWPG